MAISLSRRTLRITQVALLLIVLGGAGGYYYYFRTSKADSIDPLSGVSANYTQGIITDSAGNGLKGTLLVSQAKGATQVETNDGGGFVINTDGSVISAGQVLLSFIGADGFNYTDPFPPKDNLYTLANGTRLSLVGWAKGTQAISAQALADVTPPAVGTAKQIGTSSVLQFSLTDNVASSPLQSIALFYRTDSTSDWVLATMGTLTGGLDTATLNMSVVVPTAVQYFITATDGQGNTAWYPTAGGYSPSSLTLQPDPATVAANAPDPTETPDATPTPTATPLVTVTPNPTSTPPAATPTPKPTATPLIKIIPSPSSDPGSAPSTVVTY